jgi:hypothetical protein
MGYVYKFVHKETGKYYIGSHNKPSAGSTYMGSGLIWRKALEKYGPDSFDKEILYEGDFYRQEEERILKELDAANDPFSYNMKNESIGGSFPGEKNGMYGKKLSDEEKYKCGSAFRGKNRPDHSKKMKGEGNPAFGKNDHSWAIVSLAKSNAGKTFEEIHGEEKAKEIKSKLSESQTGISKPHLSETYKGEGNPFFGKTHTEEARAKISKQWESEERRKKHAETMKTVGEKRKGILPKQLYVIDKCVHCGIEATQSNITKWHNDNCKMNPNNAQNEIGLFEYIECPHCFFRPNTFKANSRRNFKVYHLDNCKKLMNGQADTSN